MVSEQPDEVDAGRHDGSFGSRPGGYPRSSESVAALYVAKAHVQHAAACRDAVVRIAPELATDAVVLACTPTYIVGPPWPRS